MSNSRVLVTGHTGFKGAWLSLLLEKMGFTTFGYSLEPLNNSLYTLLKRERCIDEFLGDVRDFNNMEEYFRRVSPDFVIHLAAQPLVLESYKDPRGTFDTNIIGTSNLLEIASNLKSVSGIGIVTTDKVYKNDNLGISFVESDPLSARDPYSASKVAAEAVTAAWQNIVVQNGGPHVVVLRAGNVIGGGDMAQDRLLPDLVRSFESNSEILIRNPNSTRPWQHVLDPLCGYVSAITNLNGVASPAYNFSPSGQSLTVGEVVKIAAKAWGYEGTINIDQNSQRDYEAQKLDLNSELARRELKWTPRWDQEQAIVSTIEWWKKVLIQKVPPMEACISDLEKVLD